MNEEIIVGDRVALSRAETWCQPLRKYAETGKVGTVEKIFIPLGSNNQTYRVRFDMRSYKNNESGVHYFRRFDIKKVTNDAR